MKRFTETTIWDSEWFQDLNPNDKCLWLFMRSKCDAAGVWSPNWRMASLAVGVALSPDSLAVFGERVKWIPTGLLITDYIQEQYTVLNPASSFHKPAFAALKKHGLSATGVPLDCHSSATLVAQRKEKEEVQEKEKVKGKEEGMEEGMQGGKPYGQNVPSSHVPRETEAVNRSLGRADANHHVALPELTDYLASPQGGGYAPNSGCAQVVLNAFEAAGWTWGRRDHMPDWKSSARIRAGQWKSDTDERKAFNGNGHAKAPVKPVIEDADIPRVDWAKLAAKDAAAKAAKL